MKTVSICQFDVKRLTCTKTASRTTLATVAVACLTTTWTYHGKSTIAVSHVSRVSSL